MSIYISLSSLFILNSIAIFGVHEPYGKFELVWTLPWIKNFDPKERKGCSLIDVLLQYLLSTPSIFPL